MIYGACDIVIRVHLYPCILIAQAKTLEAREWDIPISESIIQIGRIRFQALAVFSTFEPTFLHGINSNPSQGVLHVKFHYAAYNYLSYTCAFSNAIY